MIVSMLELNSKSQIACAECDQLLALKNQLIQVPGASGLVGSYVNSMG